LIPSEIVSLELQKLYFYCYMALINEFKYHVNHAFTALQVNLLDDPTSLGRRPNGVGPTSRAAGRLYSGRPAER